MMSFRGTIASKASNLRGQQHHHPRLVSRLFVITIFLNLNYNKHQHQVESSSISASPAVYSLPSHQNQDNRVTSTAPEVLDATDSKPANNLETNALTYLQKYGYMNANSNSEANNLISEDSFSGAIKEFQKFAGIPQTGVVDNKTLHFMRMPRCGNTDKQLSGNDHNGARAASLKITTSRSTNQLVARSMKSMRKRRRKRYALQGSKWRRQVLTYRISQYPTRFNGKRHEVDTQIEKAFGIWSQVAPIDFVVKKDGRVHIDIRFASGDHGDGDAFDGPGNTLAHAYFPQYGGDAHFDDQEYWTVDSYAGTNIFQVAAHELGHSLGLGHSNVREALMAPFYQKYKPNFRLHIDDVLAIQALYGEKPLIAQPPLDVPATSFPTTTTTTAAPTTTTTSTTTTAAPTSESSPTIGTPTLNSRPRNKPLPPFFGLPPRRAGSDGHETNDYDENSISDPTAHGTGGVGSRGVASGNSDSDNDPRQPSLGGGYPADLCSDPVIDAITRTEDGSSYVFKGEYYWLLTGEGLAKGFPRRISSDWEGLPGNLDAALTWADGKTFFFKGNKYWRFRNRRRDVGYPKLISAGFAGIPDDIDAAFVWSGNGRTYIFKGAEYWRFDSKADPPVSSEYPRSVKVWNGVPAHLNAAFKWENNVTYFFKGSQYYRFNDKEFKVEARGRPPFPRSTAEWWFGCVGSNLAQRALPEYAHTQFQPENGLGGSADIDWSFLAGLEETSKTMGTHISDHKPEIMSSNGAPFDSSGSNVANAGSRIGGGESGILPTKQPRHLLGKNQGFRSSFFESSASSSSSAASSTSTAILSLKLNSIIHATIPLLVALTFWRKL